jgi:hypothetical protein
MNSKLLLTSILMLVTIHSYAQWSTTGGMNAAANTTGGRVGIGTGSPSSKLHVVDGTGVLRTTDNTDGIILSSYSNTKSIGLSAADGGFYGGSGSSGFKLVNGELQFLTNGNFVTVIKNNGNVGIGTTSPIGKLQIVNTSEDSNGTTLILGPNTGSNLRLGYHTEYSWIQSHGTKPLYINELGNNVILNKNGGRVGIGTTAPGASLHVVGDMLLTAPYLFTSNATTEQNRYLSLLNSPAHQSASGLKVGGLLVSDSYAYANPGKPDMIVKGSIGIGTPTIDAAFKLSVNGVIRAKEIKVETGWADFVFADSYKLPSLQEVEAFILKNKHLPEIPSEAEVAANGISLGEINAKLLQKIEELTLYAIEQEKKILQLEEKNKEVQDLKKELNEMKTLLNILVQQK